MTAPFNRSEDVNYGTVPSPLLEKLLAILKPRAENPRTDWERARARYHVSAIRHELNIRRTIANQYAMHIDDERAHPYEYFPPEPWPIPWLPITFVMMLVQLVLVALKLTHVVDWSWWWILVPVWGPFALIALVLAALFVLMWVTSLPRTGRDDEPYYLD